LQAHAEFQKWLIAVFDFLSSKAQKNTHLAVGVYSVVVVPTTA